MKKLLFTTLIVSITNSFCAQFSCASAIALTNGFTSGIVTSPGTSINSAESWVASVVNIQQDQLQVNLSILLLNAITL